MKRIIFNNPPKDLFKQLKDVGLLNYHSANDPRPENRGKLIHNIEGVNSKNAIFGNYKDVSLMNKPIKVEKNIIKDGKQLQEIMEISNSCRYTKKYMNEETGWWISATIDLTDKGIEILKTTGLKFKVL